MVVLHPGEVFLVEWKKIYRGDAARLPETAWPVVAESAKAVERILAKGEPIYGINTGFGKLASVRIGDEDLETLQRNIVLSHAAGTGEPSPAPVIRLMMALKLASLAQGASGVRVETVELLEAMLAKGLTPMVPCQGSVGASGDLAPLAHMAAAMIGVGEIFVEGFRVPAAAALEDAGLAPLTLGPKEGLALLNGTQFSTAGGNGLQRRAPEKGHLDVAGEAMKAEEPTLLVRGAIEGRVPFHGLAHARDRVRDQRVEATADLALPARHGGDIGLYRPVAVALGDLRIAT